MPAILDVLIPTYRRGVALAVTLTSLIGQTEPSFRVVVSDQGPPDEGSRAPTVDAVVRVLEATGRSVERHEHRPRRGMAEHRDFLLRQAQAPYALFLDDDVVLEPNLVTRLLQAIRREGCGFVGSALVGLSHLGDERPDEEAIEFWEGPVRPERVKPGDAAWNRHRLHNAANLAHLRARRETDHDRVYKIAWVGGCVLYDVHRLRDAGGFDFWPELPETHAGEDVMAQLRVMEQSGGCGLFPSGAYHLELPTTLPDRTVDAPWALRERHLA